MGSPGSRRTALRWAAIAGATWPCSSKARPSRWKAAPQSGRRRSASRQAAIAVSRRPAAFRLSPASGGASSVGIASGEAGSIRSSSMAPVCREGIAESLTDGPLPWRAGPLIGGPAQGGRAWPPSPTSSPARSSTAGATRRSRWMWCSTAARWAAPPSPPAPRPARTRRSSCATATSPATAARACARRSRTSRARSSTRSAAWKPPSRCRSTSC